jgi:V/A-type H+-transporting ATPase subunit C
MKIATGDQITRLADAYSLETVVNSLGDFGFEPVYDENGKLCREEMLLGVLKTGFAELGGMECGEAVEFLKYQYDANNIKALIKCAGAGISSEDMLMELGSIDTKAVKKAFLEKDYSVFPENMARAIAEAEEAFAATSNPQKVDFIIDKATFADMLANARNNGIALAQKLMTKRIDLLNLMMAVRLIRMKLGNVASAIFDEVFIEGGGLSKHSLADAVQVGEDKLCEVIAYSDYSAFSELVASGLTLGELEKAADNMLLGVAKEARYVPFGVEIAIGYIFGLEYEVKNIRIILAGKEAGLAPEVIRERMRDSYV